MTNFFLKIYDFLKSRKKTLFIVTISVTMICIFLSSKIKFSEDISSFLPEDEQNEQINYAYQHIGATNTIIVYFTSDDEQDCTDAIDDFVNRLNDNGIEEFSKKITHKIDESAIIDKMEFVAKNLPYFLDENDYAKIDTLIRKDNIIKQLENDRNMLGGFIGSFMLPVMINDPLFLSGDLLKNLENFKMNDKFEVIDDYIFTKNGKEAIVNIESKFPLSETANNKKLIKIIDKTAEETMHEFENVKVTPFGAAYISVNNAEQIKKDSVLTIAIALILIVLTLAFSFRSFKIMMTLPAALAFGMAFAFGIISLIFNEVSIIAIGISSIIIGIAANYPLHLLDHKYHGFGTRQTLNDIVNPLTIGNITTVGAFLSLLFISSPAMKNFGLFAATLLIGTISFVLIVMPHLIPEKSKYYSRELKRIFKYFSDLRLENSKIAIGIICILTIIFMFLDKAGFDADMSKINYMTAEHRAMMNKIINDTENNDKSLFIVAEGRNTNEALKNYESIHIDLHDFANSNDSIRLTSIGNYIPSKEKQAERIALWKRYWADKDIFPIIEEESVKLGFREGSFSEFSKMLSTDYQVHDIEYFAPLAKDLAENYIIDGDKRAMVFSVLHIKPDQFDDIYCKMKNEKCFNNDNVFVFNQESILSKIISSLSDDFNFVLFACSIIVFVFLFISFGRIELTLISFLPLAIGWIWILAIMQIFDIQFNIINIILATFIFGMGDDYTIFITEGCIYEHRFGRKMLSTYKNTIALSAFIMFIGIGVLVLAKHPAMKALGEVVIIGMFTVVLMAYIIPPFIFKILTTRKGKPRRNPVTIKNLSSSIIGGFFLLIGIIYLDILGFFLLTIGGKTDRHELFYHKNIKVLLNALFKIIPTTKTVTINESGEENPFAKPSIIICNHQSMQDLALCGLNEKIIALTNHWVWHSPFYGRLIRYANYFPTENFDKKNVELYKSMIDKGYSILVFPEGSRSEDCKIHRFHKGAFYLAQELGVDIQPVIVHGFGYTIPKNQYIIKKGINHIHILKKISTKGVDYHDICSSTHHFYIEKYNELREKYETADYYADEVLNNYLYKGKEIERQVRNSLKNNDNFNNLVSMIPESGTILMKNCGIGQAALLCALVRKNTEIFALIENENDFLTAVNCASVPANLHYIKELQNTTYDLTIDCNLK